MIYLKLFFTFFLIGAFTFGGGYAMIPLVHDYVIKYNWMDDSSFYEFIGICESTPGPIAINMATFIGSTQGGFLGSVLATLGVVLPSFIVIVLVATVLTKLTNNPFFKEFLNGVKPVVIALILSTGLLLVLKTIGISNSGFDFDIKSFVCFGLVAFLFYFVKIIFKKKIPTILLIVSSAIIGIIVSII